MTYISAALFPGEAQRATLFALAAFAISFLVRPLGGVFWGPLGAVAPAYYMMAACAVGMVALLFVIETAGASLRGTQIPGSDASRRELAAGGRVRPA